MTTCAALNFSTKAKSQVSLGCINGTIKDIYLGELWPYIRSAVLPCHTDIDDISLNCQTGVRLIHT